jgi:hypothetical protein
MGRLEDQAIERIKGKTCPNLARSQVRTDVLCGYESVGFCAGNDALSQQPLPFDVAGAACVGGGDPLSASRSVADVPY